MGLPLFAIRPEPGLSATIGAAARLGLEVEGTPLFVIEPVQWEAPDPAGIDGLLLGSANALRHGGGALDAYAGKPAYVVGEATALAARERGLPIAATGSGGLQSLLDGLEGRGGLRLLRIAGAEHVALTPPDGITLVTRVAYASVPRPMGRAFAARLRGGGVVLLHSAAAARHFAGECDRLGVARQGLRIAALAPRIAEAAGSGWAACRAAQSPNEAALLALARDMCH